MKINTNNMIEVIPQKLYMEKCVEKDTNFKIIKDFCLIFKNLNKIAKKYLPKIPLDVMTVVKNTDNSHTFGEYVHVNHCVIVCGNSSIRIMAESFFHEMTHASQIGSNKLCPIPGSYFSAWKKNKNKFLIIEGNSCSFAEYYNQPHEIHARKRAIDLLRHCDKMYPELLGV